MKNTGYADVFPKPQRVFHYTRKENVDSILRDGMIRTMGDKECWFCPTMEDLLAHMEETVMREGHPYYRTDGSLGRYPKFVPEDHVVLELIPRRQQGQWVRWMQELPPDAPPEAQKAAFAFSMRKVAFRGNMKFRTDQVVIHEVAQLVCATTPAPRAIEQGLELN